MSHHDTHTALYQKHLITMLQALTTYRNHSRHIAIISGELSGDQYAADLIQQIHHHTPGYTFSGISGPQAHAQGLSPWPNCEPKKIMGFTQVLRHIQHYRRLLATITTQLHLSRPQLLILIDYAGLNLRVAKIAHQLNIPVLYYIPPKVWAWGTRRIRKIQQYVTQVAPLYPFEHTFFTARSVPSTLVQHPFLHKLPSQPTAADIHTVALLPGSRRQEINALLPVMLHASYKLLQCTADLTLKLFCAEPALLPLLKSHLAPWKKGLAVEIISCQQTQKLQACGSALVCSGTAAFECAMLKIPMVVLYRCHWFNYLLISCLARVSWASLPNLILQSGIVPELLQSRCRVDLILTHLRTLTQNSPMRKQQLQALTHLSDHMLSAQNNAKPVAQIAVEMLA